MLLAGGETNHITARIRRNEIETDIGEGSRALTSRSPEQSRGEVEETRVCGVRVEICARPRFACYRSSRLREVERWPLGLVLVK